MSEEVISEEGQKRLLSIARQTLEATIREEPVPEFEETSEELVAPRGLFVTLTKKGRLRGCLGHFTSDRPLYEMVSETAVASATDDPRFVHQQITPDELAEVEIEISVLSPMRRIDDPLSIELGTHGIYIKKGWRSGTFLPQVATEHNMTKEEFLSSCCSHKAGMAPDAWKDKDTEVYVYTAQVFHEET